MAKKLSKEEQKWQAEDDARTLARYQEIMSNPGRRDRAVAQAKTEASLLEKRANMMKRAASSRNK